MVKRFLVLGLLIISMGLYSQGKSKSKAKYKGEIEKGEPEKNTFGKGQVDLNIGLYLGRNSYYYGGYGRWTSASPLFSFSADYGVTKNFSLGGHLSYSTMKWEYKGTWNNGNGIGYYNYVDTYRWTYYLMGVRGAFHFAEYIPVENLDVYAGGMLGYVVGKSKYTTDNNSNGRIASYSSSNSRLAYGGFIGGRYRFTEKIGIYLELGYGYGYGNFGLNIKL
jgi:hypothetical protein